ncbi:MAG: hypothetical protein A2Y77_16205 [Planctomycetes bacterium RBG_13_62_9]|nr:MAG: hypothetical protein A2Y77_16205 [Planctomycetes bacterium RBG_13_62_9]
MPNDLVYMRHMLAAIEKIDRYLTGMDYEGFTTNDMAVDAVVRELEIVGEAARNLSTLFVEEHPEIPWRRIKAMRNVLIHQYFGVDLKVVWDTCRSNLPQLKSFVLNQLARGG